MLLTCQRSERCLQLINLVGELIDHLLQFGGRLEIVIVHRGLHLIFGRLKPVAQRRQSRGACVVPARRRSRNAGIHTRRT